MFISNSLYRAIVTPSYSTRIARNVKVPIVFNKCFCSSSAKPDPLKKYKPLTSTFSINPDSLRQSYLLNPESIQDVPVYIKEAIKSDALAEVENIQKSKLEEALKASKLNLAGLYEKRAIPEKIIIKISEIADKAGITTNLRLAHFLAQCVVESGNFSSVKENLNYSAKRLETVYPKIFTDKTGAPKKDPVTGKTLSEMYAGNPEKIANRVYSSIMGNGDEASGDGYKFRGRGYIQLTGKEEYSNVGKEMGVDLVEDPDYVAINPLETAAGYFTAYKIWEKCDKGTEEMVESITGVINKKKLALNERRQKFKYFNSLLSPKTP